MDTYLAAALWALLPTVGVSIVFVFILRGILHADRNERRVHAKIEAQERARRGLPAKSSAAPVAASDR